MNVHQHRLTTQRTVLIALVFALIAGSLLAVDTDAKRKRGGHRRAPQTSTVQIAPTGQFADLDSSTKLPVDPSIFTPQPEECAAAETALDGFLPKTVKLKETSTYLAKLTVSKGVSILACDLASGTFEVKFREVKLRQYGKAPFIGGWNSIAPTLTCSLRVGFTMSFSPPNTIVLSNLKVLAVNCANSPNWLDSSVVKDGLNNIFPSTIAFTI